MDKIFMFIPKQTLNTNISIFTLVFNPSICNIKHKNIGHKEFHIDISKTQENVKWAKIHQNCSIQTFMIL